MNKKIIVTFLTVIFFGAGALFFSLSVQKYQVLTSSRAESRGLGISFQFLSEGPPFSWKATVLFNNNDLPALTAEYGVYQCSGTSGSKGQGKGSPCDGNSPNLVKILVKEDKLIQTSVGSTLTLTHEAVSCGTIQIDLGDKESPGVFGGELYDTGVACTQPTNSPAQPTNSPSESCPYTQLNTQFRVDNGAWVNGTAITSLNLQPEDTIAINCFVNNGSAVMNPADVTVNETAILTDAVGSVDAYSITQTGVHTVVCSDSQNRPNCSSTDSFTIAQATTPTPTPTATPTATDTPIPTATNTPTPTDTPIPTATNTPTPTDTPIPPTPTPTRVVIVVTNTPTATPVIGAPSEPPTPTPVTQLAVAEQNPGITPWAVLLIPIAMVLLGLAL